MNTDVPVVEVSQWLPLAPSQAWAFISKPEHMKRWFFEQMPDFRAEVGFQTSFTMKSDTRDFHAHWEVLQAEPEKELVVAWTYKGIPGIGKVIYRLVPERQGTRLQIRNEGLGSFPQNIPEFHYESCRGGWLYFMERLQTYTGDQNALPGT